MVLFRFGFSESSRKYQLVSLDPESFDRFTIKSISDEAGANSVDDVIYYDEININDRMKKNVKIWDHWGKWSPCSVTCGEGKMTRWRHCVSEACAPGEKEAQIKTCKMKSC